MIIVQDTREQRPFTFEEINPKPEVEIAPLKTGDYSLRGFESRMCSERKTLVDLFGSLGKGRARFEREFQRMAELKFAALVIEADWHTILRMPPVRSKMNPKSVYRTLISWSVRYGVHIWACPNRAFAEKTTYLLLEKFWKNKINETN